MKQSMLEREVKRLHELGKDPSAMVLRTREKLSKILAVHKTLNLTPHEEQKK